MNFILITHILAINIRVIYVSFRKKRYIHNTPFHITLWRSYLNVRKWEISIESKKRGILKKYILYIRCRRYFVFFYFLRNLVMRLYLGWTGVHNFFSFSFPLFFIILPPRTKEKIAVIDVSLNMKKSSLYVWNIYHILVSH